MTRESYAKADSAYRADRALHAERPVRSVRFVRLVLSAHLGQRSQTANFHLQQRVLAWLLG
jgi:hypothetical protein